MDSGGAIANAIWPMGRSRGAAESLDAAAAAVDIHLCLPIMFTVARNLHNYDGQPNNLYRKMVYGRVNVAVYLALRPTGRTLRSFSPGDIK